MTELPEMLIPSSDPKGSPKKEGLNEADPTSETAANIAPTFLSLMKGGVEDDASNPQSEPSADLNQAVAVGGAIDAPTPLATVGFRGGQVSSPVAISPQEAIPSVPDEGQSHLPEAARAADADTAAANGVLPSAHNAVVGGTADAGFRPMSGSGPNVPPAVQVAINAPAPEQNSPDGQGKANAPALEKDTGTIAKSNINFPPPSSLIAPVDGKYRQNPSAETRPTPSPDAPSRTASGVATAQLAAPAVVPLTMPGNAVPLPALHEHRTGDRALGEMAIPLTPQSAEPGLRLSAAPSIPGPLTPSSLAQVGQQIAAQVPHVQVSQQGPSLTLHLDPPELGQLRIALSGFDGQLAAQVLADRADVAEQLRRHADLLSDAFRQAGFADVDLSFGQNDDTAPGERGHDIVQDLPPDLQAGSDDGVDVLARRITLSDRIDIRI